MSELVLDIQNLSVVFATGELREPVRAVKAIELQLQRGQILGIVGESGSGKSVTSLAIMGLVPNPGKSRGDKIEFRPSKPKGGEGKTATEAGGTVDLLALPESERRLYRGGEIATIFQEPMSSLNPVYTIGFQLTEAIQLHQRVSPPEARRQACELLQKVKLLPSDGQLAAQLRAKQQKRGGLELSDRQVAEQINQQKRALLQRYPHQLSGGQLQRVMIAMAISCHPTLLIADEPTTALDVTVQAEILDLLQELCRQENMSMIFISHDLGVIAKIADAVAVMYKGEVVESGSVEEILFNPQHPYTKGLLNCRPRLDRHLRVLPTVADYVQNEWEDPQTQRIQVEAKEPPTFARVSLEEERQHLAELIEQEPLLKVQDLYVCFAQQGLLGQKKDPFMAVNGVSFEVFPGETLGLVGESGCGKSTLARTLLRLIPAHGGKIFYRRDRDWPIRHPINDITHLQGEPLRKLRRELQIVFQNPFSSLNPRLTIGKAIGEPMAIHHLKFQRQRVQYLLEKVGLEPASRWFNCYPHELSGGQRQRVCIARALASGFDDTADSPYQHEPQLIICDESVSALDVSVQAQVLNLLKDLQAQFGLTYIFISHDLSVVRFMSDRIMVMNEGKIEEIGAAEEIICHPKTRYTQRLIGSIPKFPDELN